MSTRRASRVWLGQNAGQTHDGQIADALLDHLSPRIIVLADKPYDADRIRSFINEQGATPNIPPKSNRKWKPRFSKPPTVSATLSSGSSPN